MPDLTTTDRALNAVLGEIRWRHPVLRISCGALVTGPQLRVLASCQSDDVPAMPDLPMVGSPVQQWVTLLEAAGDELIAPNIAEDPRFEDLNEIIVGGDTVGAAVFVLRHDETVRGFVRVDVRRAEDLTPPLLEAVRNALPAAALAIELERERVSNWATRRAVVDLERIIRAQQQRDREGLGALYQAVGEFGEQLHQVASGLEPRAKQEVEASLADGTQRIRALLRVFGAPMAEAQ